MPYDPIPYALLQMPYCAATLRSEASISPPVPVHAVQAAAPHGAAYQYGASTVRITESAVSAHPSLLSTLPNFNVCAVPAHFCPLLPTSLVLSPLNSPPTPIAHPLCPSMLLAPPAAQRMYLLGIFAALYPHYSR